MEWYNTRDLIVQYSPNPDEKLLLLIVRYGAAFDDNYYYWSPSRNPNIVKRAPLWLNGKKMPAEKHKPPRAAPRIQSYIDFFQK